MANHLPIKATRSKDDRSWDFEWDDDALIAQAHVRSVPSASMILHAHTHKNALAAAVNGIRLHRSGCFTSCDVLMHVCSKGWGMTSRSCTLARSPWRST